MNRLAFHRKFLLLGFIGLVAISIALFSLYGSLNQTISKSQRELDGLALIRPVAETIQSVQKHRGLSSGVLGGISSLEEARAARESDTAASFANLEAHLPTSSVQMESWKNIRALWQRLQVDGMKWSRADNFDTHTHLIDELLLFESALADEYGLTSDPDLDTFYLIYTSGNELLNALEHLGQIRAFGTGILGEKKASNQQMEAMKTLITLLMHSLSPLKVSMEKAAHYNPGLQQAIMATYENIEKSSLQVIDEVRSDILSKRFSMPPDQFFHVTTSAIDQGYAQIYESILPTTENLFQKRIQRAKHALNVTVGFAFLLTLLAVYFMAAFYFATMGSIQTLSQSVVNFVKGDMQDRVRLDTRDELTKIGDSFNAMADEVAELISARKSAEKLAEQTAKVKSEFLANMSHEIRTPMNGIIGLSRLALNESMNDKVRNYLEKISASSQSLLGILNDILDFSKLEAGKLSIETAPYRLDQVLEVMRSVFGERALTKGIEFSINVENNVPRELIGDSLRLQQILSNLLSNAIKFTEKGQVILKVMLVEQEGGYATLRFSVTDSGVGMTKEVQDRLFEAFMQADSSTARTHGGTGLGMAISRQLLKLMDSDFTVQSELGQGTTFTFDLKLGAVLVDGKTQTERHRTTHAAGALAAELKEAGAALCGTRVLLVEDNAINQIVARKFLQLSGMEVTIANHGQEALDLLEVEDFDIVLMDIHMPVMDGMDATLRIRKNPKHTDLPIIALTADVVLEEREEYFACGMNDFVAKPIVPEILLATMGKWVRHKG